MDVVKTGNNANSERTVGSNVPVTVFKNLNTEIRGSQQSLLFRTTSIQFMFSQCFPPAAKSHSHCHLFSATNSIFGFCMLLTVQTLLPYTALNGWSSVRQNVVYSTIGFRS
jgi:hypothetical protein